MINSDDPRLTAYVLGELDDADCKEIEEALEASPTLQAEVDSIRQSTQLLDTSLQAIDSPALTDEQRAAIEEQSETSKVSLAHESHDRGGRRRFAMAAAIAGILAIFAAPFVAREIRMRQVAQDNNIVDWLPESGAEKVQATPDQLRGHYLADDGVNYTDPASSTSPHVVEFDEMAELEPQVTDESIAVGGEALSDYASELAPARTSGENPEADFGSSYFLRDFANRNPAPGRYAGGENSQNLEGMYGATPSDDRGGYGGRNVANAYGEPARPMESTSDEFFVPADSVIPSTAMPRFAEEAEGESRFDVAKNDSAWFDGEFGFDSPTDEGRKRELRTAPSDSSRSNSLSRAQMSSGRRAVQGIPRSNPSGIEGPRIIIGDEEERLSELMESGQVGGGSRLSADPSTARGGDGESPQRAVTDLLAMVDDPISSDHDREVSEQENRSVAREATRIARSEVEESKRITERSPNAIPEAQGRRQELAVTRSEMESTVANETELATAGFELDKLQGLGLAELQQELLKHKKLAGDLGLRPQHGGEVSEKLRTIAALEKRIEQLQQPIRTWRRAKATPNASRLVVGDRDELLMEGMQANVMVDGFRARVLLDLYYFNDRGRQLEGNFKLRLPNDASLYYFAFGESAYEYRPQIDQLASKGFLSGDLVRAAGFGPKGILEAREGSWSKVKEAKVVPREKAAHAYSETVRRRVDPALVEWSGAGMFNARVYPLMPKKLHRIVVGYDVNLQQVGDDFVYQLDLPTNVPQCMVDLNVSALPGSSADIKPETRPFVSGGRAFYHFDEVKDNSIELRFSGTGPVLLKGTDEQAGEFFAARVTPKLSDTETQSNAERATFLVDTSLSSRPDKFNIWLNLLEETLTRNRETMKKFSVLFFNIESHWWKDAEVDNTPENVDALMTYCHGLALEGATDLRQALHQAASPSWIRANHDEPRDLFLLSDGAVTWGEINTHRLSSVIKPNQTLFAYKTGLTGTSTTTLENLARHTGGAVFSIVNEDEIAAAATAHRRRPWKLEDVTMSGGTDLLVAGRPEHIYPGQSLLLVGRGDPDAEVMLKVSRGDEVSQLSATFDRVVESDLATRAYGQVAVGQLEDLGSSLEDVSVAYARHFRVTGQTCSLLMLDSEADYKRFNIKPEDDVFVVRSTPSADLITKKLDELKEQLGDAKTQVVAWLDKLQNTSGFQFELPTALRLVIDRLPQDAFDVKPTALTAKSHDRESHTKELIEQLDSGKLDYDAITAYANAVKERHGAADGLRSLSSLIEQNPGDPVLTRDVAYSAIEWNLGGQAFPLLQRVASMRPYEPQSYIAMAQCLSDIGHADLAMVYYEVAVNAKWHDRYKDIRDIARVEYLRLLRRMNEGELSTHAPEYANARLASLSPQARVSKADLVITMMWNTDRTDVDLHVLEPTGEECYYKHPSTRIGGKVTRDVTEGLGPEMYTLPKAKSGKYNIMANYFGSDANRTKVRTKVYITVYEDFGTSNEQIEKKTITLSHQKEKRELTTVTVK